MVTKILLNEVEIKVEHYEGSITNGAKSIKVRFKVHSGREYHDITTLLYKGTFDVHVPEDDLSFRGEISHYSTSMTNLYVKGAVGEFTLGLREMVE